MIRGRCYCDLQTLSAAKPSKHARSPASTSEFEICRPSAPKPWSRTAIEKGWSQYRNNDAKVTTTVHGSPRVAGSPSCLRLLHVAPLRTITYSDRPVVSQLSSAWSVNTNIVPVLPRSRRGKGNVMPLPGDQVPDGVYGLPAAEGRTDYYISPSRSSLRLQTELLQHDSKWPTGV